MDLDGPARCLCEPGANSTADVEEALGPVEIEQDIEDDLGGVFRVARDGLKEIRCVGFDQS